MINNVTNHIKNCIILAQNGDMKARNTVLEFIYPRIETICKDHDLTQEAILRINKYLHRFDVNKGNFVNWCFVVTKNVKRKEYEKATRRNEYSFSSICTDHFVFDNMNKTTQKEFELNVVNLNSVITGLIDELSKEQRECFTMWFFEGLTHKEVSEIKGVHVGTCKSNVLRAKESIKKKLNNYNVQV